MIGQQITKRLDELTIKRAEEKKAEDLIKLNRASNVGWIDDCLRFLVLMRLLPETIALPSLEVQRRLEEGIAQEELIDKELEKAGYEIEKVSRETNEELQLTGEADRRVKINGNKHLFDYKTCSSYIFKEVSKYQFPDDLLESRHPWIRHYKAQMTSYGFLYGEDVVVLYFKDKEANMKHTVDIPYDENYMEHLIEELMKVNEYVEKGIFPKQEYKESCKSCQFMDSVCFPGSDVGKKRIVRVTEEEAVAMATRWAEIEKIGKEFKRLNDNLKEQFKGETIMVGDLSIKSTPFTATIYKVPDEIKAKYRESQDRTRMSIVNVATKI